MGARLSRNDAAEWEIVRADGARQRCKLEGRCSVTAHFCDGFKPSPSTFFLPAKRDELV